MDKLSYIQTREYYSVLKRNELSTYEKTQVNLKCMLLRERSQPEKVAPCSVSPSIWHSGKGKAGERITRSVVARGWGYREKGGMNRRYTEDL